MKDVDEVAAAKKNVLKKKAAEGLEELLAYVGTCKARDLIEKIEKSGFELIGVESPLQCKEMTHIKLVVCARNDIFC
ncbi:MAG: hypothetical protein ACRC5H_03355 [Treponemataceae bacterium]